MWACIYFTKTDGAVSSPVWKLGGWMLSTQTFGGWMGGCRGVCGYCRISQIDTFATLSEVPMTFHQNQQAKQRIWPKTKQICNLYLKCANFWGLERCNKLWTFQISTNLHTLKMNTNIWPQHSAFTQLRYRTQKLANTYIHPPRS